jgi:hypothetical protein
MRIWIALALCGLAACASGTAPGQADAPPAVTTDAPAPPVDAPLPIDAPPPAIDAPPPIDAAPATLTSLDVTASPATVPAGLTTQLSALGHFSDGTSHDVSAQATWMSGSGAIATVDTAGLVTTHKMGSVTFTATVGAQTGMLPLAVNAAAVASVALSAAPASPLAKGLTAQLVATATFTDATTGDVSDRATWTTTDMTTATVSSAGLVTAVASSGTATITAALDGQDATATITDAPAKPASLAITSGDIALAQHQAAKLHATLTFTDGTTQDVTASATWSSDASTVVSASGSTVTSQATVSTAHISAVSTGFTATITATVTGTACHPVINEVEASGASAGDEWVELYNPCTTAINVGGWTVDYRASTTVGSQDTNLLATLAGSMQPGELRLYVGPAFSGTATPDGPAWGGANGLLNGTNGAIGLRSGAKDTGTLVDAVAYGPVTAGNPFVEGSPAAALQANTKTSVARASFDGDDTNSNATDFAVSALPTPKLLNNP